jgi:hypothetical protein
VANHDVLIVVGQAIPQGIERPRVLHLAEHVGQLVTEKGARRNKGLAQGVNSVVASFVSEREHRPHALKHALVFVEQDTPVKVDRTGRSGRRVNRAEVAHRGR